MKKTTILALVSVVFFSFKASAETQFLPEAEENIFTKPNVSSNATRCINAGYTYTDANCNSQTHGQAERCPYSNSYFKTCCPEGYVHRKSECPNESYSADSCAGFYKCGELTDEQKCIAEGYEQSPKIVNGYTIEWDCLYPDPMIRCPYDNSYAKCDTTCKDQGYFAVTTSNPCPSKKIDATTTQYYNIEYCPSNNAYIKCVPGAITVDLLTSDDCHAEGFTTRVAVAYCDQYGCSSPAIPACPVSQTIEYCTDTTGNYWRCR